VYRRR